MDNYASYTNFLCFSSFFILVGVFGYLVYLIFKMHLDLIHSGAIDEELKNEIKIERTKSKKNKIIGIVFNSILCFIIFAFFCFSLSINKNDSSFSNNVPTLRVVKSDSMSQKLETNEYLFTNDLNNQFKSFDIIFTYQAPSEFDLKLYDIVVYEIKGVLVVHRIVNIEEPNEKHPDSRLFTMQGDAVSTADRYQVTYSQIKGIYNGRKISYVGSFVTFMQSPIGWVCLLLVVVVTILTPILENFIYKSKQERMNKIMYNSDNDSSKVELVGYEDAI